MCWMRPLFDIGPKWDVKVVTLYYLQQLYVPKINQSVHEQIMKFSPAYMGRRDTLNGGGWKSINQFLNKI